MADCSKIALKEICCTCLSKDRMLYQLCRLNDGVNNLYSLLSYDLKAFTDGFFTDIANLHICFECRAIMFKISKFRRQACDAQRLLTSLVKGQRDIKYQNCLSQLSVSHTIVCNTFVFESIDHSHNFVDCGPSVDIKSEPEEDIPLSELHCNSLSDSENITEVKQKKRKSSKTQKPYVPFVPVDDKGVEYKCHSCVKHFKNEDELQLHHSTIHNKVMSYMLYDHKITCLCSLATAVVKYKRPGEQLCSASKEGQEPAQKNRSEAHDAPTDKKTSHFCTECNLYFHHKNERWKHIQRHHKEGHKCPTCGKRFAFRHNLLKHEMLHGDPQPRTECPICHKQVRVDLMKIHSRIHTEREQFTCVECSKRFISRASYEQHLKYTQVHAADDIRKYKCADCDKGYRSKGELEDHINYQHMSKTQHKCPVCGKGLATRRCITRHVRRAHDGVKESPKDKICPQCGKAFRDKKGLREHELIHTGERPLSCEICGCTFRQRSSLYTHRKRVHKIFATRKTLQLVA